MAPQGIGEDPPGLADELRGIEDGHSVGKADEPSKERADVVAVEDADCPSVGARFESVRSLGRVLAQALEYVRLEHHSDARGSGSGWGRIVGCHFDRVLGAGAMNLA